MKENTENIIVKNELDGVAVYGEKEACQKYELREGVYGIILKNDKIGVAKVNESHFLVGGGLDSDEDRIQCLRREFEEEIGYSIKSIRFIDQYREYHRSARSGNYYHLLGNVYTVELDMQVTKESESDHQLVWLDGSNIDGLMQLVYQEAAIKSIVDQRRID